MKQENGKIMDNEKLHKTITIENRVCMKNGAKEERNYSPQMLYWALAEKGSFVSIGKKTL